MMTTTKEHLEGFTLDRPLQRCTAGQIGLDHCQVDSEPLVSAESVFLVITPAGLYYWACRACYDTIKLIPIPNPCWDAPAVKED